ncbi:protein WHAT'S THIS FACTOR 9, mitochondrial isoform X2 [Impatiens glandulifera]|nr:protein WHAT'S THIS FACTOR 9, mitochondrial isoform X2 [Impatiens glandulifera]
MTMAIRRFRAKNLCKLSYSEPSILYHLSKDRPAYNYTHKCNYVDVYMKWKKDPFYDSIESIHKSDVLKPLISLKNCITASSDGCIPISDVSKRVYELDVPVKVARFLRQYPSVFEEFVGPQYNHPWFRLTPEAIELDRQETDIYRTFKADILERLKKFILMSRDKRLPFKIIKGFQWYLGLPDEFLQNPEENLDGSFKIVEIEDGLKGLAVENDGKILSTLQKNAIKRGSSETIAFPLFPSKGMRLRTKIEDWLNEFQKLPYVSPYEDYSDMRTDSDLSEKRIVAVLHELQTLFVENAVERKRILLLKKYMGLPQKVHKAYERHPHIFYLSLRNKTCTVILKEAYRDKSAIEAHPLSNVRKKYISLMKKSYVILKSRRIDHGSNVSELPMLDLDEGEEDEERLSLP